ncbi:MAG: acyltransferase [Bacteroidales bacterium]|nr:acyltransferase [Bacteroidales bacterium]
MSILKDIKNRLRGGVNVDKLVQRGLVLGKNCHLGSAFIDPSHCFHISIGDNVTFGPGVTVLAHDASTHTFLGYTRVADVKIGSNVFIGARSIVLPGVTIGDNVVVGAGSIVSRDLPSGSVAVGAPARVVKELTAFLEAKKGEMRKENTFGEEHTLRNADFSESQREALLRATKDYGCLYIE